MSDKEFETREAVIAVLDKVYDLFLTTPFEGGIREPDLTDDEETECDRAIKSDRFALMTEVRKLRAAAEIGQPKDGGA